MGSTFSQYKISDYRDGEHIWEKVTLFRDHEWIVCVWCQKFKDKVKDKLCTGPMKINLNSAQGPRKSQP